MGKWGSNGSVVHNYGKQQRQQTRGYRWSQSTGNVKGKVMVVVTDGVRSATGWNGQKEGVLSSRMRTSSAAMDGMARPPIGQPSRGLPIWVVNLAAGRSPTLKKALKAITLV